MYKTQVMKATHTQDTRSEMPPVPTAAPLLLLRALRGASTLTPRAPSAVRRFSSEAQAVQSPRELYRSILRRVRA